MPSSLRRNESSVLGSGWTPLELDYPPRVTS